MKCLLQTPVVSVGPLAWVVLACAVLLSPASSWAQSSSGLSAKDRVAVDQAYSDVLSAVGENGGNMMPKTTVKSCQDKPVQLGGAANAGTADGVPRSLLDGFNQPSGGAAPATVGNVIVYCP